MKPLIPSSSRTGPIWTDLPDAGQAVDVARTGSPLALHREDLVGWDAGMVDEDVSSDCQCPLSAVPVGEGTNDCVRWTSSSLVRDDRKAPVSLSAEPLSAAPHSAQNRLRPLLREPQTGQFRAEVALAELMAAFLVGVLSSRFAQEVWIDGKRVGDAEAFHHNETHRVNPGESTRASRADHKGTGAMLVLFIGVIYREPMIA